MFEKQIRELRNELTRLSSYPHDEFLFLALLIFYKYISIYGDEINIDVPKEISFDTLDFQNQDIHSILKNNFALIEKRNPILKDAFLGRFSKNKVSLEKLLSVNPFKYFYGNEVVESEKTRLRIAFYLIIDLLGSYYEVSRMSSYDLSILFSRIIFSELKEQKSLSIYNPVIGLGELLLPFGDKYRVSAHVQAYDDWERGFTIMHLLINGISDIDFREGELITEPMHRVGKRLDQFELVIADPPFDDKIREYSLSDKYGRWGEEYNLPKKIDRVAPYVMHVIKSIRDGGLGIMLVPNYFIISSGSNQKVRKYFVENGFLHGVINLPSNIHRNTTIATSILVFSKTKNEKVFMIDASKEFEKLGFENLMMSSHIEKIISVWESKETIRNFSGYVSLKELRNDKYDLTASRYFFDVNRETEIRKGYKLVKIKELVNIIPRVKHDDDVGPILRMRDLSDNFTTCRIDLDKMEVQNRLDKSLNKINTELLLLPRLVQSKGVKLGWFKPGDEDDFFYASPNFYLIKPYQDKIDMEYLINELYSLSVQKQIESVARGTIMPRINKGDLLNLAIQIPDEPDNKTSLEIQRSFVKTVKELIEKGKDEQVQLRKTVEKLRREMKAKYRAALHNLRNKELGALDMKMLNLIDYVDTEQFKEIRIDDLPDYNYNIVEYIKSITAHIENLKSSLKGFFESAVSDIKSVNFNLYKFVREFFETQSIIQLGENTVTFIGEDDGEEKIKPVIEFDKNSLTIILENILDNIKRHSGIQDLKNTPNAIRVVYDFEDYDSIRFSVQNIGETAEITEDQFFTAGIGAGKTKNTGYGGGHIKELAELNGAEAFMNTYDSANEMDYVFEVGFKIKLYGENV